MTPNRPTRRQFNARLLGAAAAVAAPALPALAQDEQPIRLMVGFPPGGGSDAVARLLADKLKDLLQRPVVVDNRPGAGGQLAAQLLKAAPADGSVLFLSHDHTISILPQVVAKAGFDPQVDFTPLGGFATFVNGLAVSGANPAKTVPEYLHWVQTAAAGKGSIGVPAPASTPEFLVQLLARRHKLDLVAVPYKGSAPMMADMLGNQIAAGVASVPDLIENHRAGKLRMLAVLGGQRQPAMPEVPTFAELGIKGLEDTPFYGVWAPRGTPAVFANAFTHALDKAVAMPEVRRQLTALGLNVGYMTPQQLDARERAYRQTWADIIRESGFKPQ